MTTEEEGFREIQLNGKQLVFLFMAVTVVSVVIFLSGVLVGRGVRAERVDAVQSAAADGTVAPPAHGPAITSDDDPRKAAPPPPAGEEIGSKEPADRQAADEPPVAINRTPAPRNVPKAPEQPAAKAAESAPAKQAPPAAAAPAKPPAPPAAAPAPAATPEPAKAAESSADASARVGYAVQVAAVTARGEAESIVKRLTSKGYANAYVEEPKGQVTMFRVRVGTFKTRREAQATADRLRKEEKFKPWVTR